MTQVQTTIATAADYADAMIIARRAKNWLFGLLLLILLAQIAIFFVARYTQALDGAVSASVTPVGQTPTVQVEATTAPAEPVTVPVEEAPPQSGAAQKLEYLIGGTTFIGMGAVLVMAVVLLLIVLIMLIGRLIGVSRVTSALIWSIILGVLLFPWQAFLNYPGLAGTDFRIPGVLYTWSEVAQQARFGLDGSMDLMMQVLKWARFVGFPVLALLLLLMIQTKSSRGLKLALGEADADVVTDQA